MRSCRTLLIVLLLLSFSVNADARRRRPQPQVEPSASEIKEEWVLQGDESDAIYEKTFKMGGEEDAVVLDGIKEGGEMMAIFENELPDGAQKVGPKDIVAPEDEREGMRVVPGVNRFIPGGVEPGEYDGTKDTNREIWRLEGKLAKSQETFRFYKNRVFKASVEVIRHKEPRWNWGSHTTEEVKHTKKWQKVKAGEKVIKKRVGKRMTRKKVGYRVVRKLKRDPSDPKGEETMMPVRCPVYERLLAPEYQRYNVPVYRWKEVKIGTYKRKSFLTWIKRYRWVKRTYVVWRYWGTFDAFAKKYPKYVQAAKRAQIVTDRMMKERCQLMRSVQAPRFDTFLQSDKPEGDPRDEFLLKQKRRSTYKNVMDFVEHDVPEAELVTVP